MADAPTRPPKKTITPGAWQEARALVYAHRGRLTVGLALMLVNRLAGLVLPSSSKWVIDRVINQHHPELLLPLALAAGGATVVQAITGFGLSQILCVAAQRAITDMRRTVQAYVLRLPISYFDSTKSGILISRIMTDAEGIRNLVGTGLVQLAGGLITAAIALGVLFYLNWRLTLIAILILGCFGGGMAYAFAKLRPLFRDRGNRHPDDPRGRARYPVEPDDAGRFLHVRRLHRSRGPAAHQHRLDRHANHGGVRRAGPDPRDPPAGHRGRRGRGAGPARRRGRGHRLRERELRVRARRRSPEAHLVPRRGGHHDGPGRLLRRR